MPHLVSANSTLAQWNVPLAIQGASIRKDRQLQQPHPVLNHRQPPTSPLLVLRRAESRVFFHSRLSFSFISIPSPDLQDGAPKEVGGQGPLLVRSSPVPIQALKQPANTYCATGSSSPPSTSAR